jgi:hypothetical protein
LQFAAISEGSYDLEVSARGFNDLLRRGISYSGEKSVLEATLSIQPFSCGYSNKVEYRPPSRKSLASVSGRVVHVDRLKVVRGVEVTLIRLGATHDKITARSDNQGNFPCRMSILADIVFARQKQVTIPQRWIIL